MNRALPTAALLVTTLASIATSKALVPIEGRASLGELDFAEEVIPLTLAVESTGALKVTDITDARLELSLVNPSDASALVELYLLDAPFEEGGIPEGLEPVGSVMVRGALDEEPGAFEGELVGGVDGARTLHFALVSDGPELSGVGELVLSAFFTDDVPSGRYAVEVIQ